MTRFERKTPRVAQIVMDQGTRNAAPLRSHPSARSTLACIELVEIARIELVEIA
jgi:hypothetical protein